MQEEYWDCHKHRDELKVSEMFTVYHLNRGQLCFGEKKGDIVLFYPIEFKNKTAAYRWIREGYIAELQEGLSCLWVCFTKKTIMQKNERGGNYV